MISWSIDTDAMGELMGFAEGLSEVFSNPQYLDRLATLSHNRASQAFDQAAAASAGAGFLQHVFEYGVPGVTEGPARFTDPTSPAARLYVHNLDGTSGRYDAQFIFRPAVAPNPPHTAANTGISTKYLSKLSNRKYVFRQRARLMEYGGEVNIKPKNGRFLFVPAPSDPRGFVMWDVEVQGKGITMNVGENTAGTFTAFWEAWWESEGQAIIDKTIDTRVRTDVSYQWTRVAGRARTPNMPTKPVAASSRMESVEEKVKREVARNLIASAARFSGRRRK